MLEADFMLEGRHLKITPLDAVELGSITQSTIFTEINFVENNFSYLFYSIERTRDTDGKRRLVYQAPSLA